MLEPFKDEDHLDFV